MSITARELYAAAALQALPLDSYTESLIVSVAWDMADAMDEEGRRRLAKQLHYATEEETK
jgi:hypothetical protein